MSKQNKESGFAALEALLLVVIVAIVGGTGYFVWHSKLATETSLSNTASSQSGNTPKTSKTSSDTKVSSAETTDAQDLLQAVQNYNAGRAAAENETLQPGGVVKIQHDNGTYALGSWEYPQDGGGSIWFAKKDKGSWVVQSQGQMGHCEELAPLGLTSWEANCTNQ